jgi:hypothetical protein
MHTKRLDTIFLFDESKTLTRYAAQFDELPPIVQQSADTVKAGADQIDEQQDIDLFVQENKTGIC